MTELSTEVQDVRTETLELPGATLAYDTRTAEAESSAPALLMIAKQACPAPARPRGHADARRVGRGVPGRAPG
jgi:hypothetical protein